jgi:hypothetical protein
MLHFIKYLVVWISQNLSIPFWMVGHVHLTLNIYEDIYEIIASFSMNVIVAVGFYLSYKEDKQRDN